MHNDEMGDYEMFNHVVEYEAQSPDQLGAGPEGGLSSPKIKADLGDRSEHRWTFELAPLDSSSTVVTETYDCIACARMAAQRRQRRYPLDRQHDPDTGTI